MYAPKMATRWEHWLRSKILRVGATKLSEGVVKGAEATGRAIQKGGAKIRDRITPEETPSDVSPHVTRGLNVAKKASGGAVRVSQFLGKNVQIRDKNKKLLGLTKIYCMILVNGVATVAGHVAEKVAPHVKKHGSKLVPESLKKSKDGQASNLDGAKLVAVSSLQGIFSPDVMDFSSLTNTIFFFLLNIIILNII